MKYKATNHSAWIFFLHFSKVDGLVAAEVAYARCISKIPPPLHACSFFSRVRKKKTPSSPYRKRSEMCNGYVLLRILRRIISREGGRNRPKIGAEQEVRSMISRGRWVRLGLGRRFSYFFLSSDRILGNLCDRPGGTEGREGRGARLDLLNGASEGTVTTVRPRTRVRNWPEKKIQKLHKKVRLSSGKCTSPSQKVCYPVLLPPT